MIFRREVIGQFHCKLLLSSESAKAEAIVVDPDQPSNGQNLNILQGLLWALKLGLFSLNTYRRGRDAVKLTAKRIINNLGVAKFQGEYLNISFWELWRGIIPFKITGEKLILKENKFSSATQDKYLGIIAFRKFDVGIRNLIWIID